MSINYWTQRGEVRLGVKAGPQMSQLRNKANPLPKIFLDDTLGHRGVPEERERVKFLPNWCNLIYAIVSWQLNVLVNITCKLSRGEVCVANSHPLWMVRFIWTKKMFPSVFMMVMLFLRHLIYHLDVKMSIQRSRLEFAELYYHIFLFQKSFELKKCESETKIVDF